ncbi:MAG: TRAP transporter large permease [Thermodesulfobacteriota bacterium]
MSTEVIIVVLVLLGCMAGTVPVFMSLFFAGLLGLTVFADMPLMIIMQTMFRSMDNFSLVVVLFFVLCGNIMTAGSIVNKLVRVANVVVGWMPGGLGMVGIITCGLFGAISGSTVATVVAIGGFMIPALMENHYNERYSLGVMTTSPILGIVIPPSISMILYSMVTSCSLQKLFMTGFVPGILIITVTCTYTYIVCRRGHQIKAPVPTFADVVDAFKDGVWSLMLPVIIFAGIFSGIFTANEAAVVACAYAFVVEIVIHRDMNWEKVFKVTVNSAVTSATLLIIVSGATCFGRYLSLRGIPDAITNAVVSQIHSPWVFLLAMNVLLLIVGMFMDIISATLILTPIFLPMLNQFGINVLHFGLLMTVNLGIGYATPPLGVSLYITGAMTNRNLIYTTRACLPFLAIQIGILLLLSYWPDLVLILPKLWYGSVDEIAMFGL